MKNIKEVKQETWSFYNEWRKSMPFSPALKCTIKISLLGWNHLVGNKGQRKRTSNDVYRRMKLLPYAKEIIEKSTTVQNITVKNNKVYYALEAMIIVKEDGFKEYRKIRVIIIEDAKGNKIFFSVMDKKDKI